MTAATTLQNAAPQAPQRTRAKARVLLDALPFMRAHSGSTMVVKVGGAVMEDERLAETFAQDMALLRLIGVRPVLVHGGGPQVSQMCRRLGIEPVFLDGHRVTDAATLEVARMVLVGLINQELVTGLVSRGTPAVGLSGSDDRLLLTRPRSPELGLVGDVEEVNVGLLEHLIQRCVPVVATIGADAAGQCYNVNADVAAAAVAGAMGAAKLIYLTDVPGVLGADGQLLSELSDADCRAMIPSGAAGGGMGPKLASAVDAMAAGVERVHVLDGRVEHALILELFTPEGLGTMITHERAVAQ